MNDLYIYGITALLPLSAILLVLQRNPYDALVIRGILGAIAALVYTLFGAADVALTEALVGTMLAITLYAVAVRSSLVMRLGIIEKTEQDLTPVIEAVRRVMDKHYLRLDILTYPDQNALHQALMIKDVHSICLEKKNDHFPAEFTTRVLRLHDLLKTEFSPTTLAYLDVSTLEKN